jgi:hypothetical protein
MKTETRHVRKLWALGLDTQDIAERMKIPECRAYNIISRRKEAVQREDNNKIKFAGAN